MKVFEAAAAAVLGLATLSSCHMQMEYPPPFKSRANPNAGSDIDYSMTAPLNANGANFPCKGYQSLLGSPAGAVVTTYTPGQTYNFTITGSANHGGGSCQASLSYDKGKTFKVIQSFIGGCPPQQDSNWDFTVPSDAPSGDALFAWTWFNVVGNREMYMNCAAVTIGGGGKKRAASASFSSRPDMFVANVGTGLCTVEGKALMFPNPGPNVNQTTQDTLPPASCAAVAGGAAGGGSGSGSGAPASSAAPAVSSAAPVASSAPPAASSASPAASSAPVAPGGVFITQTISAPAAPSSTNAGNAASSAPPAVATSAAVTSGSSPATSAAPAPVPSGSASPATPPPGSGSASGSTAAGTPCSVEGQWSCVANGTQFQRCASGAWSAAIPMAGGTSCKPGTGDSLIMAKRRFVPRHFRRVHAAHKTLHEVV